MVDIAILGYGTVGSGVVEVFGTNQASINKKAVEDIRIKYILDLRDFPGTDIENLITHDFNDILFDDDVKIVVEVMGGLEPAYTFVKKSLLRGKSVVTSNKELVAKYGAELLEIARDKNINFLFEASVGGGIPIIRPLNQSLTADEIYEIMGILNGTTNYILTKMEKSNMSFDDALKLAQEKGYAERNPAADVEGFDACRKIAILLSLALGQHVDFEDIYTEGITKITKTDFDYAKTLDSTIKLLAVSKKTEHDVFSRVSPAIISKEHPLAVVNNVFNAIFIKGNVIGEVMFYGKGAGKLPTASAVVADIVDAVKHMQRNIMHFWSTEKVNILNNDDVVVYKFVRVAYNDFISAENAVKKYFPTSELIKLDSLNDEFAFITSFEKEIDITNKLNSLLKENGVAEIRNIIRVEK